MTTVLIASCNEDLCESIKAILDLKRDLYPITCSCKYEEILSKSEILTPQFIVVDLMKDYKEGLSLIGKIRKRFQGLQIIAVTISNDQNIMIDAFRCGIDGYLVKEGLFNEMYRCVCTLLQGDKYVSLEIVNNVLNYYIKTPDKELERSFLLSQKEIEHIRHIANGLNPKEIAHIMKISKKTVDNYRNRIMVKLNFNSIADIVKYAIREQIIEL
jgi:DNA-binding NarL/FixJ family response regulator